MNFSRAAQRVHVVQSALSTSVSKLEKELGVELFDRSRQQIKITPAGELFREHARRVIQTARLARDSISDFRGALSGTIEIGSLISFGALDVPQDSRRVSPRATRSSESDCGTVSFFWLDERICQPSPTGRSTSPSCLRPTASRPESTCGRCRGSRCCSSVRPDHHLAQRDHVGITELAEEDLIGFPSEFGLQRIINDAFAAAGIAPHMPYEAIVNYSVRGRFGAHTDWAPCSCPPAMRIAFPDLRAVPLLPAIEWRIFLATAERHSSHRPAPSWPTW